MTNKTMNQDQKIEQMDKEINHLKTLISELRRKIDINQCLIDDYEQISK